MRLWMAASHTYLLKFISDWDKQTCGWLTREHIKKVADHFHPVLHFSQGTFLKAFKNLYSRTFRLLRHQKGHLRGQFLWRWICFLEDEDAPRLQPYNESLHKYYTCTFIWRGADQRGAAEDSSTGGLGVLGECSETAGVPDQMGRANWRQRACFACVQRWGRAERVVVHQIFIRAPEQSLEVHYGTKAAENILEELQNKNVEYL